MPCLLQCASLPRHFFARPPGTRPYRPCWRAWAWRLTTGLQHSPPGSDSATATHCPAITVAISDTGSCIGSEALAQIFTPFYTTKPEGTGLGLPISARIVAEHGGWINVESIPQTGSTFTIVLPLPDTQHPESQEITTFNLHNLLPGRL